MMRIVIGFLLGVSLWGSGALAQLVLTPPPNPPPTSPTQVITLVFELKNHSSESDIFEFSLELPDGVQALSPAEPVELAAGEDEKVFISLLITPRARAGTHTVTLRVRGRKNSALTAQASVTITVREAPGLHVIAPPETSAEPGSALLVKFIVRNTGNTPDRLELSVSARAGLSVRLSIFRRLDLAPGESREVPVEVFVPKEAPPLRERLLLRAVSQRFENISAEATAIINILPPLPQDVGGSLLLTIPSQVGFRIEGQTGAPVNAFVNIQSLGGVLIPDLAAVAIDLGGSVQISNSSGATITVTVSDGRPLIVILNGTSATLPFTTAGFYTVTVSGGALIPTTIIVTVHDLVFRQTLQGRGPLGREGEVSFWLDLQNLFQLNAIFFGLKTKPWGFALGDLRPAFGTLASLTGRGGQILWHPGLWDTKLSFSAVAGLRRFIEAELTVSDDLSALPTSVTVRLGQPVRFRNTGLLPHSVTIPGVGTQILAPGQSFVHIFSVAGPVLVTIDAVTVTFIVTVGSFCDAPFLFCAALDGGATPITGLTWGTTGLLGITGGFSPSWTATTLSRLVWAIPEGSATSVEGGLSFLNGAFSDSALGVGSELRLGDFSIRAQVVRAGRDFVGDRRDEQSLQIFQSFGSPLFSFSSGFERWRNNVENDPLQQTLHDQSLRAAMSLKLAEAWPLLRLSTSYRRRESSGPGPLIHISHLVLSGRLTQPLGKHTTLSFFTDQALNNNFALGVNTGFSTVGLDFSLYFNELRAILRIERRTHVDLDAALVLSQKILAAAGFEWRFAPFALRFGWLSSEDRLDLSVGLDATLGIALLSFFARTSVLSPSGLEFDFALSMVFKFDAPIVFIVAYGRVEGVLFVDANGNGRRDPTETGIKNIVLILDNEKARTDETGFYRFPPMPPGSYKLTIERLPLGVTATVPLPREIALRAGQTLQIEIPLTRVAVIDGIVFNDLNRNGALDGDERGLARVKVMLTDSAGQTRDQLTDSEGRFAFSELIPGEYILTLDGRTLPENFIPTTPAEVRVTLKPQERVTIVFGAAERPRAVKFPPVADFTFTPASPKAGERVRFDASESFDPDGQIVQYEWDFDSDGKIDAQGVRVEHVFTQPGEYIVTLTVTDNDGEKSTARKTVTVGP